MDRGAKISSCQQCIWQEQCSRNQVCGFFDDGREAEDYTDEEISELITYKKDKFLEEYYEYVKDYEDE